MYDLTRIKEKRENKEFREKEKQYDKNRMTKMRENEEFKEK